jgi:transposase
VVADNPMDESEPMTDFFDAHRPATAFDHDSTLVVVMELSGKSWLLGAAVPGVSRRPKRGVTPGDMTAFSRALEGWKREAAKAGRTITRVVVAYEAGADGFWIARELTTLGIEVYVMQPASIPVERKSRRAKTDLIDIDMLLRTLLAWLRGEPRVCTMVRVPSVEEEDRRRSGRERDRLTSERVSLENRVRSLLRLQGIDGFRPRLKKAGEMLERLRTRAGSPLPAEMMAELRRAMTRLRLIGEQIDEINAAREAEAKAAAQAGRLEGEQRMIHFLTGIVGVGLETATRLVREVFCRPFKDRRGLAAFVGLTGTPFQSGGMEREQGIAKNGDKRIRGLLLQLAWRWLRFQSGSALGKWFAARVAGGSGRMRKIMVVALARKLLVALWRGVHTGVVPEGARLADAA